MLDISKWGLRYSSNKKASRKTNSLSHCSSFVYIPKHRHKLTPRKRNTIQFCFKYPLVAVISYHCCLMTSHLNVLCFRKRPNLNTFPAATNSYHTDSSLIDHSAVVRSQFYRTTRILSFSQGTKLYFYCHSKRCTTSEEKTGNYYRPNIALASFSKRVLVLILSYKK